MSFDYELINISEVKILAIIVSYNFERWIDRCLGSLKESLHPPDVIVLDNCSKDNTVERVKKEWPDVRLIANDENLGFGKANNMGISIALKEGYDAVFLLNQDAWIDQYTLGTLAECSEKFGEFGILSPVHCDGGGINLDYGFAACTHVADKRQLPYTSSPVECKFINAAFWFIPIRVIKNIGGFSPLFYHYGEDKDYVNRIAYHGYKLGYVPTVFGCHDRAFRKTTESDFFRGERVYLLSEYLDINHGFCHCFAYSVLAELKKACVALLKLNFKYFWRFMGIANGMLIHTPRICRFRGIYKEKRPHFVD